MLVTSVGWGGRGDDFSDFRADFVSTFMDRIYFLDTNDTDNMQIFFRHKTHIGGRQHEISTSSTSYIMRGQVRYENKETEMQNVDEQERTGIYRT